MKKASFTFSSLPKAGGAPSLNGLLFMAGNNLPPDSPQLKAVIWLHLLAFLVRVNVSRTTKQMANELAELQAATGRASMANTGQL